MPSIKTNAWNFQGIPGLFAQHKGTYLSGGEDKHPVVHPLQSRGFSQVKSSEMMRASGILQTWGIK